MVNVYLENISTSNRVYLWKSTGDSSEDTFGLTMDPDQRIQLCFESQWTQDQDDDEAAYLSSVEVGFGLRIHPMPRSLPNEEIGPDAERALKVIEAAINVETDWDNLIDHFSFLRSREATYLRLTDEILGRIMGWTIVEAVVVVLMAVCQVLYWRKFFEQKRYL